MATTRLLNGAPGLVQNPGLDIVGKEKSSAGTQADGYYNGAVSYEALGGIDPKVSRLLRCLARSFPVPRELSKQRSRKRGKGAKFVPRRDRSRVAATTLSFLFYQSRVPARVSPPRLRATSARTLLRLLAHFAVHAIRGSPPPHSATPIASILLCHPRRARPAWNDKKHTSVAVIVSALCISVRRPRHNGRLA